MNNRKHSKSVEKIKFSKDIKKAEEYFESILNKVIHNYEKLKSQDKYYEAYNAIKPWINELDREYAKNVLNNTLKWIDDNIENLLSAPIKGDIYRLCNEIMDTMYQIESTIAEEDTDMNRIESNEVNKNGK